MFLLWIQFIIYSALIFIFGYKLSKVAGKIVASSSFSAMFMGVFFLSIATSLPEVVASISTIKVIFAPNMGVGDVIGSLLLNLMIISVLEYRYSKGAILGQTSKGHILVGGLSLIMMFVIMCGLIIYRIHWFQNIPTAKGFFVVGIENIIVMLVYVIGIFLLNRYAKDIFIEKTSENHNYSKTSNLWIVFILCTAIIFYSGIFLTKIADKIVTIQGWDHSYFGTIFIGIVTSLPEVIVSCSSLGLGSIEMAVGNILGSNLFDMLIIPVMDICYPARAILSTVSSIHIFTLLLAMIMTTIVMAGMFYRSKKKIGRFGWDVIAMMMVFIIGNIVFYWMANGR